MKLQHKIIIIITIFILSLVFTALFSTSFTIFITFFIHAGLLIYLTIAVLMEKNPDSHGDEYYQQEERDL